MFQHNIRKIAEEIGVSHTTIYRTIRHPELVSEGKRKRIAEELIGRGIPLKRDDRLVVLVLQENNPSRYNQNLAEKIQQNLKKCGIQLIIKKDPAEALPFIQNAETVISINGFTDEYAAKIRAANDDILLISLLNGENADILISPDDFSGGKTAAEYMLEHQYTERVLVLMQYSREVGNSFENRAQAFQLYMRGLLPECSVSILKLPVFDIFDCKNPMKHFFANLSPKQYPQAIFCTGRFSGDLCVDFLRENNLKIPILGYDEPAKGDKLHSYDRIVFSLESIVNWCVFFVCNRHSLKVDDPIRVMTKAKIMECGNSRKQKKKEK